MRNLGRELYSPDVQRSRDESPRKKLVALRNLGFGAGEAGREPAERFKSDPVYMESYRRGREKRQREATA
jgi:hypothetical protein